MPSTPTHDFLHDLPKCEHHIHIEGTLSPDLLFSLASANNVALPVEHDPSFASPAALRSRYARFSSLDDFLHYYFIGFTVLLTADDFERLTYAYLEGAYAHGLRHAEVFFDPQAHTDRGVSYETVVAGMSAARARAASQLPDLSVMLIPCVVRHLPVSSGLEMLRTVVDAGHFRDGTVAGLGLSSTEKGMDPARFAPIYDAARRHGVPRLTAHYGEEGPAAYVRDALSVLGVSRIDHGRRVVEDPDLVAALAESRTLLTLCPVSNVVLRGVDRVEDVPVRALLDAGVPFSINSDDPAYFGADLVQNYYAVQDAFNLSFDEWETIARSAIDGSWCDDARKTVLHGMVTDVIGKWKSP
ncbi:adenosine deaminase [Geosmithia morbida]|uniref:Adenine deaminase n=1 Tax=Geosmithia morbida TaxID=1094350 RepID=A0A9P5CZ47_9HYPO|nr:adenosine deaminase [Geosmithia morbida]KAF4121173.1 adenosine deaminase [Geosmithia morbida]